MSTANVLKYSALGLGLFVGIKNDLILKKDATKKAKEHERQAQLDLIEKAKREYASLHNKTKKNKSVNVDTTNINWEDPKLDYGSVIMKFVDAQKE
ncbi:hypothetical protein TPHA_0D02120 [Tetrapisispora phaffii CBS 4417]|uniref:ATP synthase F(0) complex subunit e, mitochondrial n=1 Tax=Tetrapisispora phaffii (strain ATCC 24235 / CBS 4417 / NBRC 1672 / NRRL Y-8282 / UCD 70-5) TaxID=1071381 RepID=G8BSM9_TETPH|nr:hypothetical protein TPHA_0D02120 [Tetrapisispora phaffii CBS 4417]CCE62850.1 hypothetical protein TPHA_0D02120 [Tetrapisispora phaffii CBS 4417]